jgi:hypothetical protein
VSPGLQLSGRVGARSFRGPGETLTVVGHGITGVDVDLDRDRLVLGLAAVFAGLTVLLVVLAFVRQLFLLFLALPFAATTYVMWHHATGRLEERTRRRARARNRAGEGPGGPGPGPTSGPGGFGATARGATGRRAGAGGRATAPGQSTIPRHEAYDVLDLDPGANEEAVRRAYRSKVKEVHPDADGGDEEAFKRVNRAYERLSE